MLRLFWSDIENVDLSNVVDVADVTEDDVEALAAEVSSVLQNLDITWDEDMEDLVDSVLDDIMVQEDEIAAEADEEVAKRDEKEAKKDEEEALEDEKEAIDDKAGIPEWMNTEIPHKIRTVCQASSTDLSAQ